jgi:xylulokinase
MKTNSPFLCVDIGTSSIKGGLFDSSGTLISMGRLDLLTEGREDFQFWDSERWGRGFKKLVSGFASGPLAGIVLSGNGPTLVPVDEKGSPVFPALLWIDGREKKTAGQRSLFLPKAAWLMDNRPEEFEKTRWFLPCPEYLAFLLTGEKWAISPSAEFNEYLWTEKSLSFHGLPREKFPPILCPGREMGRVTAEAAARFGLPECVPVYSGGPDFLMSLLGTSATRPGRTCDRAGTSEGINYCSEKPHMSSRLRCLPHIVPGRYNVAGILSSTGRLFEWFRKLSGQDHVPYDEMLITMQAASGIAGTGRPDLPWFFPSIHKGAAWEFSKGMFIGLGADHGKNEMGLAVVESIGFAVRNSVEILENHGCFIDVIRVSGGQAKNATWNQMKADIVGKPILVPEVEDAELVGNLCAGLAGRGDYADLVEASENLVRFKAEYTPDPGKHAWYSDLYQRYLHAYSRFQAALKGC